MSKSKTDVKLIILGSANVGKTCLLQRYLTGNFAQTISSIGASLALKKWGEWNVALWDTAGEEKYAALSAFYCRGASVAILSFDLTDSNSLVKLKEVFIPLLLDSVDSCLIVVVGTKLDLVETKGQQVSSSEGRKLAEEQHQIQVERALKNNRNCYLKDIQGDKSYFEISSKTGEGVTGLFDHIQSVVLAELDKNSSASGSGSQKVKKKAGDDRARLDSVDGGQRRQSGGGCCGGSS